MPCVWRKDSSSLGVWIYPEYWSVCSIEMICLCSQVSGMIFIYVTTSGAAQLSQCISQLWEENCNSSGPCTRHCCWVKVGPKSTQHTCVLWRYMSPNVLCLSPPMSEQVSHDTYKPKSNWEPSTVLFGSEGLGAARSESHFHLTTDSCLGHVT